MLGEATVLTPNPPLAVDMEGCQCGCQCSCSCYFKAAYSPSLHVWFAELNLPSALALHAMSHIQLLLPWGLHFEVRISASKHVSDLSRHVQVSSISVYHWRIWKITIVDLGCSKTIQLTESTIFASGLLRLGPSSGELADQNPISKAGTKKHLPIPATHWSKSLNIFNPSSGVNSSWPCTRAWCCLCSLCVLMLSVFAPAMFGLLAA